ncbi:HalOD1 output domain-containing protein [Halobaculum roseum]|uniref:HalOD1 output domain-containing protein n=1 Tax=Halobaculum roseum TaxID=2175149 RepID=A0ABD5MR32_9EURY|nr:HalOD1 output domain-containing protein [Halobaculum roseum]QZY04641.1 hypothetical protein K6T36_16940 [Halobaculum roseum]
MTDGSDKGGSGGDDETVRAQYNWSSTAPSMAVIEMLRVALGREEATLEPLFDSIAPDAFFRSKAATESATDVVVSFTVAGRRVTIRGGGGVVIRLRPYDE